MLRKSVPTVQSILHMDCHYFTPIVPICTSAASSLLLSATLRRQQHVHQLTASTLSILEYSV